MTTAVLPAARSIGAAPLAGFVAATGFALVAALRAPAGTAVLGLAVFGILHNVLELRYVAGRFETVLAGPFLKLLVALITGIVACRLLPVSTTTRSAEILLVYGLLAAACLHSRPRPRCCCSPRRPRSASPATTSWC